ncbi:MAG: polyprenyl synthetase family protein [Chloroflexota bacterium]|nr:polyprenyl synthetase family protein [Chloroflexota bacterium]
MKAVVGSSPLPLYQMLRYHLGWIDQEGKTVEGAGGKALRPTLCLLACESVGGDWRQALPAAAALELLHNFSLIHDDIQDRSAMRRHRSTVWHLWGAPQAINAGDAMFALARLALLRAQGLSPAKAIRAGRLLDETGLALCEGQYMDMGYESRLDIGVDAYFQMVSRKTAALIATSAEMGALLGCDDERPIGGLRRFGQDLGHAFQVVDDLLGIWGREEATGKSSTSDIAQKKKSFPVVYALERAPRRDKEELLALYGKESLGAEDIGRVVALLDKLGARQQGQKEAERHYRMALGELEAGELRPSSVAELRELATFVVQRDR